MQNKPATPNPPLDENADVAEIFADNCPSVVFAEGNLRVDFAVTRFSEPIPPNPPQMKRHIVARLVLGTKAMMDLSHNLSSCINALVQQGVLKVDTPKPMAPGSVVPS